MQATRGARIAGLIERADEIEDLARGVQESDATRAASTIRQVERAYRNWYAEAMAILPDDLAKKFQFEYEGNFAQYRIRHFLQHPLEPNALLKSPSPPPDFLVASPWQYPFDNVFRGPFSAQKQLLLNALAQLGYTEGAVAAMENLNRLARRLPAALAVLKRPYRKRPGKEIRDEYDLQWYFHSILQMNFEDVREEEYTPSRAGGSARIDFIVKDVRLSVETKMTRDGLGPRELGNEIAEDIARYRAHPDVDALFVLVYDPTRRIVSPGSFERDTLSDADTFPVKVVISQ